MISSISSINLIKNIGDFKYHLYASNSQMFNSSPDLSPKPKIHIYNFLLVIFPWMSNTHGKLKIHFSQWHQSGPTYIFFYMDFYKKVLLGLPASTFAPTPTPLSI